jgi:hypothetical protein
VNGQPWPATFRPYGALPWNTALSASASNVDTASTAALQAYMQDAVDHIAGQAGNDYSHPVYLASTNDPLVHIGCSAMTYGCYAANAATSSLPDIHVPAQARPAYGTDGHFAIIQPDGTEFDFWETAEPASNWATGATITAGIAVQTSILGSGAVSPSATSGAALAAGQVRFDELARGLIPHAIFLVVPCTANALVYPGSTTAADCASGGIPIGALVQLTLTDAQINALPATTISPFLLPILRALHDYGGYVEDTSGGSQGAPFWEYESLTQYASFGQTYPGLTFAQAHGYTSYLNPTYLEYSGGVIRWSQLAPYMRVLSSCYAKGTCS